MNLLLIIAIGILSVARTARLIVFDEYPPMAWLRDKHDAKFGSEGWGKLIHCGFCAAPYLAVGMMIWALAVLPGSNPYDWYSQAWWWVVINGTWGGSYVASIIVAYDQPE
jgi:hypothetical protein